MIRDTDNESDRITACPECDTARITHQPGDTKPKKWRCQECEHEFDDPVERERYRESRWPPANLAVNLDDILGGDPA